MAMAYKAPSNDKHFHFHITDHALERFRERVAEEHRALDQGALALLLDDRLWDAHQAGKFTEVVDGDRRDERTWIFQIEARTGHKHFVVTRKYHPGARPALPILGGPIGCALAAVTVLTSEMASANYANGIWRVPDRRVAEKLAAAGITASPPKGAPAAPPVLVIAPAPEPIKERKPRHATGTLVERVHFAKEILRERPSISGYGPDGLSELVRAKFGVGMAWETITRLKEQVAEEQPGPAPAIAPATTRAPAKDREPSVAEQLTLAIEVEKKARWLRDGAEHDLKVATAKVDELMSALRASRE